MFIACFMRPKCTNVLHILHSHNKIFVNKEMSIQHCTMFGIHTKNALALVRTADFTFAAKD